MAKIIVEVKTTIVTAGGQEVEHRLKQVETMGDNPIFWAVKSNYVAADLVMEIQRNIESEYGTPHPDSPPVMHKHRVVRD